MLTDSLEAFFSGITSGAARIGLALLAATSAFVICGLCGSWGTEGSSEWFFSPLVAAWWWTVNGGWGILGVAFFFAMLGFLGAFIFDRQAKLCFFVGFSAAMAFASPVTFDEDRWALALSIYLGLSFCYWVLPYVVARVFGRKT